MENTIWNMITISGNLESRKKLLETVKSKVQENVDFDFRSIIPIPENCHSFFSYWNTSSNVVDYEETNIKENNENENTIIRFISSWTPPFPIFEKLASMFPELEFLFQYEDECSDISGYEKYKNGASVEKKLGKYKDYPLYPD